MEPEQKHETNFPNGGYVILRYWHIILMLAVQLVALGIAYGALQEGQADMLRRITNLENNKIVTRDEFDSWRSEFRDSLNRIEDEILQRNAHGVK